VGCASIGDEAATVFAGESACVSLPAAMCSPTCSSEPATVSPAEASYLGAMHDRNAGLPLLEVVSLSRTAVTDAMVDALTFGVRRKHLIAHAPADPELEGWIPLERLAEIQLRGALDEFALPSHTLCTDT
jgi:hypothetical protein